MQSAEELSGADTRFSNQELTEMITRVELRNFKKFTESEFDLKDHLVVAGQNDCGKTTLLQAIAAWSQLAFLWRESQPDIARNGDGNYPGATVNRLKFYSVPLADFDHLWKNKEIDEAVSIWLHTNEWKIGFEVLYENQESVSVRPASQVREDELYKYVAEPLVPVYIPPVSGVDIEEPFFNPAVVSAKLARAQSGSVLRNLLLEVSRNEKSWSDLQRIVRSVFGYELGMPSEGAEIGATYSHPKQNLSYDLSSAASGFLQVLTVCAVLLSRKASVVLVDEPDAHLHVLLQDRVYGQLREYARENRSQLIISTHSESLIRIVHPHHLCVLRDDGLKMIADTSERSALINSLTYLDNMDMCLAKQQINPAILYVEGHTDIAILREWARKLDHRLAGFLEEPFWRPTVYDTRDRREGIRSEKHFEALKLIREDITGVELHDSDGKMRRGRTLRNGLVRIFWRRYEIESYLVHPEAIARFARSASGEDAAEKVLKYMEDNLPPVVFDDPTLDHDHLIQTRAKRFLFAALSSAGIGETDCSLIAAQMKRDEIHSEVTEKLDAIADCLGIKKELEVVAIVFS